MDKMNTLELSLLYNGQQVWNQSLRSTPGGKLAQSLAPIKVLVAWAKQSFGLEDWEKTVRAEMDKIDAATAPTEPPPVPDAPHSLEDGQEPTAG